MAVPRKKTKTKKAAAPGLYEAMSDKVFDRTYWLKFGPAFTIEGKKQPAPFKLSPKEKDQYKKKLIREGYIQLRSPGLKAPYKDMTALFDKIVAMGLPPVFAFVYDEFWSLSIQLNTLLKGVLGEKYAGLPDFWAWRVAPGQAGWTPHRDKTIGALFPDKKPKSVTVWMPLNEAHPLNGCMYLLPADRDQFYGMDNAQGFGGKLPDVRALPGNAGDVFVWTQHVFHWGGRSADEHHLPPRMSVAFEYQRLDVAPFNRPLLDPVSMPTFENRLALIAKQVMQYRHMYSFTEDLVKIAMKINGRYGLPPDSVKIKK